MPLRSAYSRQCAFTGHSAQMRRAISTPTPSLGKKVEGGLSRHTPFAIHSSLMTLLLRRGPRHKPQRLRSPGGSLFFTTVGAPSDDAVSDKITCENHSMGGQR